MDLVTQTVLGAAVGEVVLGRKAGNKAILWGAIGGLIPDLDVLVVPFFSEVNGLFVHRGFSHSLLFAFIIAPLMGWLIYRIHRQKMDITRREWTILIFWAAFTHPILDYFTTYGTGAFLPFSNVRVELSTIGIVDIFYTLPLIISILIVLFLKRTSGIRRIVMLSTVIFTTLYLAGTVGNKLHANATFREAFSNQEIKYNRLRTTPLPLTNFLWMGIAEVDSGYYMGLYSNFDADIPTTFEFIPRNESSLNSFAENDDLKKLIRFTKGYYHVGEDEDGLYLADLRFGRMGLGKDADYVFKFNISHDNEDVIIRQVRSSDSIEENAFTEYIKRIGGQ